MWTPKRILLVSACFLAFFTAYLAYSFTYIGRIDGLPPLPEIYQFESSAELPPARKPRSDKLTEKLRQAFGPNAKELNWAIRIDIHSRDMLVCAEQFEVIEGRVCLTPLSIAILGKEKNDGLPREIHTIRGDLAYLEFDRKVTNFSEIASRKITRAELSGRIEVVSNRRRLERDQDLRVNIPTGKLYYEEAAHRIHTEAFVILEDFKSKPKPHKITGKGMEMELLTEVPAGQRKGTRETITGVKWIALRSAVRMDLYLEGGAGLVNSKPEAPSDPHAPPKPPQRSHLRIDTPGSFRYELNKSFDLATFDVRPAGPPPTTRPAGAPKIPEDVTAVRTNLQTGAMDQLVCQRLVLRLRRRDNSKDKSAAVPAKPKDSEGPMEAVEIETVHATALPGKAVDLVSDAEHLHARGQDFFHDAIRQTTILKGKVEVDRDESKLLAAEVRIQNMTPPANAPRKPGQPLPKPFQHLTAQGPGDILFVDKKEKRTLRANWRELLTSTRDGNQDLLILTGEARFIDDQSEQTLKADVLKVWLDEATTKAATSAEPVSGGRRPRHLEATGNVVARSRDMNVHDTGRLVVWFKDVETNAGQLPAPTSSSPATPRAVTTPGSARPFPTDVSQPLPVGPEHPPAQLTSRPGEHQTGPALGTPDRRDTPRPFDLSARSVEVWVLRGPGRNAIDQLWCEGRVQVRQDPARAEEQGTEVRGETLRMTGTGDGLYNLVVTGDLAELQTDKIYIVGPEVNIEQATNKAWVIGDGAMKMDSETNFQGDTLDKAVPLTVLWKKSMLFNGESAEFYGNIQATQENARLACQQLQVYFNKPISLRQGNKTQEPARVRNLVCSKDVRIEDSVYDGERLVKYQRLEGPCVQMIALESDESASRAAPGTKSKNAGNLIHHHGPGSIRIWEPGSADQPISLDPATPRSTAAKPTSPASSDKMRMTYVTFQDRMDANSKKHMAQFWKNVRVLHIPCPRHDMPIDIDMILFHELPENALYITSQKLKVMDSMENGKPNKQMEAHEKVYIQGRGFWARADSVYYNEQKQQIILEGRDSGNAVLYKSDRRGDDPQTIEGRRIYYNRATGEINGDGIKSIRGATAPRK